MPKSVQLLLTVCLAFAPVFGQTVSFTDFSSVASTLTLSGAATVVNTSDGNVLRLSKAVAWSVGGGFTSSSIPFQTGADAFSTFFQFRITNPGGVAPADGIVFVLRSSTKPLGSAGAAGGYANLVSTATGIPDSIGIEFDTFKNDWDINNNHVSILTGGAEKETAAQTPYGVANCISPVNVKGCLANGHLWSVWIDYDGVALHVALADNSTARPADLINYPISLVPILAGNTAYVGFTSATGSGWENHDIVNWQYRNSYWPITGPETISQSALTR
jgi:hypothetical protein